LQKLGDLMLETVGHTELQAKQNLISTFINSDFQSIRPPELHPLR